MNILLIFFALPIATIILAIVLQRLIKCPLAVAAIFFAIYLIVTFAAFDINFLVFAILYTILAYVTAVLTKVVMHLIREHNCGCHDNCGRHNNCECHNSCDDDDEILNVSTINTDIINTNTIRRNSNNNNGSNCGCNRYRRF